MKVVIIGAGPCGIMSAIRAKQCNPNYEVTLLEKNESIGQRIKVSGNGRCNFANTNFSPCKYNHPEFIKGYERELEILKSYLKDMGFYYFADNEGRCYPNSESSGTFLYILKSFLERFHVVIKNNTLVKKIVKQNDKYIIETNNDTYYADKIVIAIGGVSLNYNQEEYHSIVSSVTSNITKLSSSLTPIATSSFSTRLEGKRTKANVTLMYKDKILKEEKGEVLFKKNGVSGIVIFNMSSYLARLHLATYDNYKLKIDMLPNLTKEEFSKYKAIDPSLKNLLQEDIAIEVVNKNINPKEFVLDIKNLYDLKNSQVTSGGVCINEMNQDLSLLKDKNIYIGGETLDIDGECGGYNIEFALLSGIRIGSNL